MLFKDSLRTTIRGRTRDFLAGFGAAHMALIVSHDDVPATHQRAHLPPTDPHI
jgi:hypothetical protein